jgi:hypothetical protein
MDCKSTPSRVTVKVTAKSVVELTVYGEMLWNGAGERLYSVRLCIVYVLGLLSGGLLAHCVLFHHILPDWVVG